ncbi:MAG: hypothetical protein A3F84_08405 [Candidatus Handelsmanbacteria bacterium RIFCSPLOWO2_12_FULL_64_10]|uniref:Uncharacterized protein n=1 Tax=Handelsmanbacteria sp. (strain RIFCSPLOWO2_12_FULL_64_10) TaxID=1817868 RepID=A0A1F6D5I7_HANXR|nr:MAG: hypothetical protein A3F84_08405 [Candidatus Handelsmanbacteria bacterium RIFCSPLOWO2_12_FULL_64_10]
MHPEFTASRGRSQPPTLDPHLLALLHQHRDLTRQRLAISREIEAIEREMWAVEQTTRAVPGAALVAQN